MHNVHVRFEYLFILFKRKKIHKTVKILKVSFIVMFVCFFFSHIFPQFYTNKNKIRHDFHKNSDISLVLHLFIHFLVMIPSSQNSFSSRQSLIKITISTCNISKRCFSCTTKDFMTKISRQHHG